MKKQCPNLAAPTNFAPQNFNRYALRATRYAAAAAASSFGAKPFSI
ncbi:MAG: hypothetical protein JST36_05340 [Bacteroidetes bacterium]|nr:hypothetical protein [Bacteroidota bacterium]